MSLDALRDRRLLVHALAVIVVVGLLPVAVSATPQLLGADRSLVAGDGAAGMQPAVQSHDLVFVGGSVEDIEEGDVIAYRSSGTATFRRVALVTAVEGETAFIAKGDALERPEEDPVLASQVLGRTTGSAQYLGSVIGTLRATPVLGAALIGGVLVYEILAWLAMLGIVVAEGRLLVGAVEKSLVVDGSGTIELTRADLTATTASLGALTAFAVAVLVAGSSPTTIAVAILAGGLFVLAVMLWRDAPPAPAPGSEGPTVVQGSLPMTAEGRTRVTVGSGDDLVGMAVAEDQPLAVDRGEGACFIPHGEVVYVSPELPALVEDPA